MSKLTGNPSNLTWTLTIGGGQFCTVRRLAANRLPRQRSRGGQHPNPPKKEVGREAGYEKPGIINKFFTPHMKNIPLSPILPLFVLVTFFSCAKDPQTPIGKGADLSHLVSMTKGEGGILHLEFRNPAEAISAKNREEEESCTLYEAIRFFEIDEGDFPDCDEDRVRVDVKFRLIKMHKQTLARTALTSFGTYSGVGGLNISWYNYPPLTDYWYDVEFEYCVRSASWLPIGTGADDPFWIADFWGDDGYGVHLYPCDYADASGFIDEPIPHSTIPGVVITQCTLNPDCSITP
ncbi:MAG: hypothetical protein KF734_00780 [Saprospiraceae bacterium]|nr:hypothetical protein [Saprospiraceae bacterium]